MINPSLWLKIFINKTHWYTWVQATGGKISLSYTNEHKTKIESSVTTQSFRNCQMGLNAFFLDWMMLNWIVECETKKVQMKTAIPSFQTNICCNIQPLLRMLSPANIKDKENSTTSEASYSSHKASHWKLFTQVQILTLIWPVVLMG